MDERLAISRTNISSERDTRAIRLWLYAVAALVLAVVLADYDAGCPVRPASTERPTRKFADVPADVEKDGAALPP
jgi:hypothetical protein